MPLLAVQPVRDPFSSLSLHQPLSNHFPVLRSSPFPALPDFSTLAAKMQNNGGRNSYSSYGYPSYPPHSQAMPESYPGSIQPQVPGWTHHSYESNPPVPQPMWHPQQQHIGQPMPSPIQYGGYEVSMPLTSPLSQTRSERSHSLQTSTGIPSPEQSPRESHRAESPGHADLNLYGFMNPEGTWSCAYPGCTSRAVFTRGCDLRKHHKRHTKSFFCRYPGCTQATGGGFSSKKDLARHEAKHNPGVVCEWAGCDRIFSRVDNMRDHVKRIHLKNQRMSSAKHGQSPS